MAKAGILPTWLATCRIPLCAACHYGKASKVPWRVKGDPKDGKLFEATVARQVVSVNQLQSTVPGLFGQIKGWLAQENSIHQTHQISWMIRTATILYKGTTKISNKTISLMRSDLSGMEALRPISAGLEDKRYSSWSRNSSAQPG
jgi:hypothetical protein